VATGAGATRDGGALRRGRFMVFPRLETPPVPGWLVVAPLRHVEQWDALDEIERREIGPLLAEVAAALRAETPTARVYVSAFGEVLPHFHVHVVARPPDLAAEERGPRLFLAEARVPEQDASALAMRVLARLASGAAGNPSPWPAALLSALVWPGAGQIKNRRYVKAALLSLATMAVLVQLVAGVVADATALLLDAPAPAGLGEIWDIALEVQRRNAGSLSWLTLALVAIWAIAVADAWRDARKDAGLR
jgi:diadenosine tetraphosphate (Ap4A) HIT family hydrolase